MFYEKLKGKRESQDISLEQISNKTKINLKYLEAIESGNFSKLPETYIRLFLKTYAEEIGVNPSEVLKSYKEYVESNKEQFEPETEKEQRQKQEFSLQNVRFNKKVLIVLIVLVFSIILLKQIFNRSQESLPVADSLNIITEIGPIDTISTIEKREIDVTQDGETISEILTLIIDSQDSCWIRSVIDYSSISETILMPNSQTILKANERFELILGRPHVVSLYLNGEELIPVGEKIAPTRLIITKNGIIRRQILTPNPRPIQTKAETDSSN
jgi:transcriptional regulator with XRE-family HTH domain